jgi:hypothetical protein
VKAAGTSPARKATSGDKPASNAAAATPNVPDNVLPTSAGGKKAAGKELSREERTNPLAQAELPTPRLGSLKSLHALPNAHAAAVSWWVPCLIA